MYRSKALAATAVAGTILTVLTGCGSGSTTNGAASDSYATYNALTGSDRDATLYKDAIDQGGALSIYTPNPQEAALVTGFNALYPKIKVTFWQSTPAPLLQRVMTEGQQRKIGADIIDQDDGDSLDTMNSAGLLADYKSPVLGDIASDAVNRNKSVTVLENAYVESWNTKAVRPGDVPTSYQDLADPKWKGRLSVESTDWPWYMAAVNYLEQQQHMSEADASALMAKVIANAQVENGKVVQGQSLTAGQTDVAVTSFQVIVDQAKATGAPVAWQPVTMPIFIKKNGSALVSGAKHPAAAELWMDYVLSDAGQKILSDQHRIVVAKDLPNPLPSAAKTYLIPDVSEGEAKKWSDEYTALIRK